MSTDLVILVCLDIFLRSVVQNIPSIPGLAGVADNFYYDYLIFGQVDFFSPFFCGIVFAKHDALATLKELISRVTFKRTLCVVGCAAIVLAQSSVFGDGAMLLYVPLFVAFVSVLLDNIRPLKKLMVFFGGHSTNMWLTHTFYCYYFLEVTRLVYCTGSVWIDFLILTAMSLAGSIVLNAFWKAVANAWRGIRPAHERT